MKISTNKISLNSYPLLNPLRIIMLLTFIGCFFSFHLNAQQLLINEFLASNGTTNTDEFGDADDWIEIYNPTASPVNLGGYYITDDLTELDQWQIPTTNAGQTTIPAGGYLLLWADKETEQGILHVDIKLGSGGEDVALVSPDGVTIVDSYTFGVQAQDVSEGRSPNGGPNFDFFGEPTPNEPNNTDPGLTLVEPVSFSSQGGIFNNSQSISLTTTTNDADIHYTTDGSEPTVNDPIYSGPIIINSNTPLRARGFAPPLIESKVRTQTYLFNISHTFPVVAYTADPDELFDPETGMYTNFEEDIEIVANAELYETDGTQGFNMLFESELQGTGTVVYPQKSLALKAKKNLDGSVIPYEVFPDEDLEEYRSLVLRNNGQDWNITHFRDAMVTGLVRNVNDVSNTIEEPIIYGQADRPSIVYLNGEYWGIYNIRERMDKRYIKNRFDEDDDEIDFLENESEVREGDFNEWNTFEDFFINNDLSNDNNFAQLTEQLDPDHYRDYIVFNLFVDNADWPGNNNRYWKKRDSNEKWRWLTWDLDFSFGLFNHDDPGNFNSAYFQANSLERLLNPTDFLWPNPRWATDLFNNMLDNDQWRYDLINRMADQLNVLYTPERMNARISQYRDEYAPEIQEHHDLWSSGFQVWNENVQKLRTFANGRPNVVREDFVSAFDEISGTTNLTVNLNPANRGSVAFSTINVAENIAPFSGTYFRGIPIPVRAIPNRGYVLNNWSGALNGDNPLESLTVVFNSNSNLTANFIKGSTSTQPIVINEINYNSPDSPDPNDWVELHNPNNNAVNISGWYFEDESGDYFGLPKNTIIPANGYLVLAEDLASFQNIYPNVNNVIGDFGRDPGGFGLSGGGELITLKNANGVLIDEVEYDDKSPWPTEPDGDGPTLQLIDPGLDNALASSWKGTPATPGANNGTIGGPQNQTINFPAISDKNINDGPFTISATATSSLPVSFEIITGPATISGNTITLNGTTGTVRVRASQPGNGQWNPAPSVDQNFNVTSGPTNGDCDDITWTTTSNSVTISGVNSGNYIVKLFSANYNTIFNCTNCPIPVTIDNLDDEVHHIDVQLYTENWQAICTLKEDIILGGNPTPEIDLSCPSDITIQIPQGNTTTTVNYSLPSVSTNCAFDGLSLNRTGGPITGSSLSSGFYIVNYQATDNCNNIENCSFNIIVEPSSINPPENYCQSNSERPWEEWIARVAIGSIDNASAKCGPDECGYSDYTDISTTLSKDNNHNIQLIPGLSWSGHQTNLFWRVWIDLNQDGDFSDSGERVLQGNSGNQPLNGAINIPVNATNGATRMRVSMKEGSYPTPCESFTKGEVEDYTIIIRDGNGSSGLYVAPGQELLFLRGAPSADGIQLNWTTNTDYKNDFFAIGRSYDGVNFTAIEHKDALGLETTDALQYQTYDYERLSHGIVYYQIQVIHLNGGSSYSNIIEINNQRIKDKFVLFPNPAQDEVRVDLSNYAGKPATLQIHNAFGEEMAKKIVEELPIQPLRFDLRNLPAGTYSISAKIGHHKRLSRLLVIIKE